MDLNNISAEVRPRGSWEAVDLGFHMVRNWWKPMLTCWLIITAPIYFILNTVFFEQAVWVCFGFWLCLPLWERVHLFIVSHALFGDVPSIKRTVKSFVFFGFKQWLPSISWRRFSPSRSFNLPVIQLENLKSTTRARRLQTLHYVADGTSFWLTATCLLIEIIAYLTVPFLVLMFNPVASNIDWIQLGLIDGLIALFKAVFAIIDEYNVMLFYLAISLISPFYVVCGFALYLNRRTALEAWDLEIAFRRLARRVAEKKQINIVSKSTQSASTIKNLVQPLVALLIFSGFFPADSYAREKPVRDSINAQQSMDAIKEILYSDEFVYEKTEEVWDLDQDQNSDNEQAASRYISLDWLANALEYILYGLFVGVVLFLVIRFLSDLDFSKGIKNIKRKQYIPEVLFGLDMRKEKLPKDIVREAQYCWQSGQFREALSLLYRAGLIQLMHQYDCEFLDSYTEGECVTVVNELHKKELADYFYHLSRAWQLQAYAHRNPDDSEFQNLCSNWTGFFQVEKGKED